MIKRFLKNNFTIFVLYFLLAIILTYPLIFNILKFIPGNEGDSFLYLWNQSWIKYCLTHWHNPYITDFIAYPFRSNLAFSALTMINSLVGAIFQFILPPILSFNLVFLLGLTLASFFTYQLVYFLFKNRLVAFFAGLVAVYNSYIYSEMLGHFNYVTICFLPLFILFFIKLYQEDKIKNAVLAGLILALAFYNDGYYAVGLFIFLVLFMFYLFINKKNFIIEKLKLIIVLFLTTLIVSFPLWLSYLLAYFTSNYPLPNFWQVSLYSPDFRSLFVPASFNSFYGGFLKDYYTNLSYHGSIVYLGFVLLILSFSNLWLKTKNEINNFWLSAKPWVVMVIVFLFLSLGVNLYFINGLFHLGSKSFFVPLPFALLHFLPIVNGILVPPRLIIFAILGLTILASLALTKILAIIKSRIVKVLLIIVISLLAIGENLSLPIKISNAEVPKFYYELAQTSDDSTVLELPFALSTSFYTLGNVPTSSKLQYYQAIHGKKILNAWLARVPDDYYNFYSSVIGLNYLINPSVKMSVNDLDLIKPKAKLNFEKLNIKYIIIHGEYYQPDQLNNTIDFLYNLYNIKPESKDGLLIFKI